MKFPKPSVVKTATKEGRLDTKAILFDFKAYKIWKDGNINR